MEIAEHYSTKKPPPPYVWLSYSRYVPSSRTQSEMGGGRYLKGIALEEQEQRDSTRKQMMLVMIPMRN